MAEWCACLCESFHISSVRGVSEVSLLRIASSSGVAVDDIAAVVNVRWVSRRERRVRWVRISVCVRWGSSRCGVSGTTRCGVSPTSLVCKHLTTYIRGRPVRTSGSWVMNKQKKIKKNPGAGLVWLALFRTGPGVVVPRSAPHCASLEKRQREQ